MQGDSFRRENIKMAHEDCALCTRIAKLAVNNFRESHSQKTTSSSGTHWAEVTK